eukprot:GHVU01188994.1.p1 GENE.GHVU01188994.1~~GHVU01188994.1.p1  ORF type:complete len:234 (-),score=20.72 GHVU01188994.1:423-1124(-)
MKFAIFGIVVFCLARHLAAEQTSGNKSTKPKDTRPAQTRRIQELEKQYGILQPETKVPETTRKDEKPTVQKMMKKFQSTEPTNASGKAGSKPAPQSVRNVHGVLFERTKGTRPEIPNTIRDSQSKEPSTEAAVKTANKPVGKPSPAPKTPGGTQAGSQSVAEKRKKFESAEPGSKVEEKSAGSKPVQRTSRSVHEELDNRTKENTREIQDARYKAFPSIDKRQRERRGKGTGD